MYVVTFYSFKGGVGRSMALMNVAFELARRGRKVLVVDFDLEAPGMETVFPTGASNTPGLVDYVTQYMATHEAPDVRDFVSQVDFHGASLWTMNSGAQGPDYVRKLNLIDWGFLYNELSGYLLFEDLRQQWRDTLNFDYVFIDSRTGHTDVGGICTRQLPDAVALLFLPNEQNIRGLVSVTNAIRNEREQSNRPKTNLIFCPSNVPDLDDEEHILSDLLTDAARRLNYETPTTIIHHYNSLALLSQNLFVAERPHSRLAKEYVELANAIIRYNIEDRDGALLRIADIFRASGRSGAFDAETEGVLSQIRRLHPNDPDIAWRLAGIYNQVGDFITEAALLGTARESSEFGMRARARRARIWLKYGDEIGVSSHEALRELREVINSPQSQASELIRSVGLLRETDPAWLDAVTPAVMRRSFSPDDAVLVAEALMFDVGGSRVASQILKRFNFAAWQLQASLIGGGQHSEALAVMAEKVNDPAISQAFNKACATWGKERQPSLDLFEEVLALEQTTKRVDANFFQCLALSCAVLDQQERALRLLDDALRASDETSRVFSCWTFLFRQRSDFVADVEEMRRQLFETARVAPAFLQVH